MSEHELLCIKWGSANYQFPLSTDPYHHGFTIPQTHNSQSMASIMLGNWHWGNGRQEGGHIRGLGYCENG